MLKAGFWNDFDLDFHITKNAEVLIRMCYGYPHILRR